jgi:exosome complex component RRP45
MEILSNNQRNFITDAASQGLRIDGRGLFEYRKLSINFMKTRGQVEVSLGDSLIFCVVDINLDKPYTDRPSEGFLNFNVNFLPMAHPQFESLIGSNATVKSRRYRNEISQEIERILEKSIKKSRALNTESLCILSGKYCWNVSVNINILAHHGNLIDLCTQGCILALMHARIPDIKVKPDKTIELLEILKPLSLHFLSVSITFGFLKSNIVILDPEIKEESVIEGKIVVCMNIYGDILALQKTGGAALSQDLIFQCLDLALQKTKDITQQLRKAVESTSDFDFKSDSENRAFKLLQDLNT